MRRSRSRQPRPNTPSVASLTDLISGVKRIVSRRLAHDFAASLPPALVRRVVDEAEEIAWTTDLPHLFLPVLAEERVRAVSRFLGREKAPRVLRAVASAV